MSFLSIDDDGSGWTTEETVANRDLDFLRKIQIIHIFFLQQCYDAADRVGGYSNDKIDAIVK